MLVGRLVVALAAIQTVCSFAVLALAFASGDSITNRPPQVVLALAFAAASLFLGIAASRDSRRLFLLATFIAAASAFGRAALTGLPEAWSAAIAPAVRGIFPEAFMPACLWQFALDFPRVRRFTSFDVSARRVTATAWLLGTLFFGINLVAAYHPIDWRPFVYLLRDHPSNVFRYLLVLMPVPAIAAILVRSQRAPLSERRKVARFTLAIAAGTTPLLLYGVVRSVLPDVDDWLMNASPSERIWLDALIVGALAATPILSTIAVITDRPFELEMGQRTSRYVLGRGVVTTVVVGAFAALFITLYSLRHVAIGDVLSDSRAPLLLSCLAAVCLLLVARTRLLNALDRLISHRALDHHEQLARALERIRIARGSREIIAVLGRELRTGIGAETVRVMVPADEGAFMEPSRSATPLPPDAALIAMLREAREPIDLSSDGPLLALLPQEDRDWVVVNDVGLVAPLKHRDGAIAAVVLFGPKRGGLPFDLRDRWLTTTLTTAAAAACEADRVIGESDDPATVRANRPASLDEVAFECQRCGLVAESPPLRCSCELDVRLASLPRHLGEKFVVQRRVGAGGMGVVYLARDMMLDRDVALKTLPELRPGTVTQLRDEARAMATLNHESLATIYGLEQWRRTPVLVVEYFPKGTLARRLANGPLSPAETVRLGCRLARALTYMHARGVLHRDLKPSNIAFTAAGAPKLLDFGLATLSTPSAGADLQLITGQRVNKLCAGTPAYLPPEAYRSAPPTPAFDLWALSVIMLEAITGVNPFVSNHRVVDINPTDVCSPRRGCPPALVAFFERALAERPELRFETSRDVQSALEALELAEATSMAFPNARS